MINLPASLTGSTPKAPVTKSAGSKSYISLPAALTGQQRSPAAPSGAPQVEKGIPAISQPSVAPGAVSSPLYGASNILDQSGKPLETFRNDEAKQSQLLSDRVYPGFDPTKAQPITMDKLHNGRIPVEVSNAIRTKLGAEPDEQLDHLISLELSGSNQPSNLNLEKEKANGTQFSVQTEDSLAKQVVAGKLSLLDAQKQLARAKGVKLPDDPGYESAAHPFASAYPTPNSEVAKLPINASAQPSEAAKTSTSLGDRLLDAYPSTLSTLADLQMDPASLKADPHKAITDYWKGVTDSVKNAEESIAQVIESRSAPEAIGNTAKATAATVGAAISPITSLFSAANDIPVVGTFSKLLTLPFSFMGDAGQDTAKVLVNSLPVSDDTKSKIVDGIGDLFALAGQFAVGGISDKAGDIAGRVKVDGLLDRGSDLIKRYGLKDATTIVEKAKDVAEQNAPVIQERTATEAPHAATPAAPVPEPIASSPEPVSLPEKAAVVERTPAPIAERGGFVNPGAFVDSAKEALAKAKEGAENSKYGEALRTYFTGERDSRVAETNQLRDQLQKGLSPKEQEALTLMRDFKNKPGELAAFEDGTHKLYDSLPKEERAAAVKRVQTLKPIIDLADKPTANMTAADAAMTDYFSKHLDEGKQLGFLDSKIGNDEYISHLLQPKEDAGKVVAKGGSLRTYKIGRDTPFSKERVYPTVLHAIASGVEPRTLNALDALTIYGDKHATAAATRLLVDQLKDSGVAKWGSHGSENIPSDWKPIAPESRLFQNQRAFVDEEGKPGIAHQSLFAPEKVVDALRPLTDPDYTDRIPGFKASKFYQGYLKAAQLGLSIFHLKAMNITALGNEGVTGLVKSYATDMKSPEFLDNERAFIKAGGTSPILGRTIEAYRELKPSSLPSRLDLIRDFPGIKQASKITAGISKLTFDIVQRKFKVTDFALKDAKWIADNPDATPDAHYAAQRAFAKEINATYGGLNWEALGINKMTQSILRFGLLAPDWTFSNWFNVKGAFEGGPGGKAARAFWIRSAITGVVLTEATSLLMSGKPSKNPTNVYLGKDKSGKDIYQNLFFAGAPSDAVNLVNNIKDYGAIGGFAQTLYGKSNALIRTGVEVGTNRNYLGQTIVPKGAGVVAGTGRSALNLATEMGPVPFSVTNLAEMFLDPSKQFTEKEYATTLLGGTRPRHVIPDGMRQVTSGKKKGQLVPQTAREKNSTLDIIKGSNVYKPAKKK